MSLVNDVWRFLDGPLRCVVLNVREGSIGKANLPRWLVPELQTHDFGAGRDEPTFHGAGFRSVRRGTTKRKSAPHRRFSPVRSAPYDQGQTIVHVAGSATPIVHIFGVLAWMATARQLGGGPGSSVAVTVTSGVGLNP